MQISKKQGTESDLPPAGSSEATLRILQITDLHLYSNPAECLLGQNTRVTLDLVLDLIKDKYWPADRLVLTGDLVHDESPDGYRYLHDRLSALGKPCNCLPGNHDLPSLMSSALGGSAIGVEPNVRCGAWNLVFLDSTIRGEDGGHLDKTQLHLLQSCLAANPQHHALVCLHHQPVPIGSRWMDAIGLNNPDEFFAVIDRNPQVRGIIWGHVHQEFSAERNGVVLLGAPSTCIQFRPDSEDFEVDTLTSGFRWLDLHPNGDIDTGVERIAAYPEPLDLDLANHGY